MIALGREHSDLGDWHDCLRFRVNWILDDSGSIFLIALIFHVLFSLTTIKLLHIFRTVPSVFCISYLQSTMALD